MVSHSEQSSNTSADAAESQATTSASDETVPAGGRTLKKIVLITIALALIMVIGMIPVAAVAGHFDWQAGIKIGVFGYVVALIPAMTVGRGTALALTGFIALATVVGELVSGSALGLAAVITVATLLIPIYAMRSKIRPAIIAAMMISNAVSPAVIPWSPHAAGTWHFYLASAGIVVFGGLWGLLVGSLIRAKLPKGIFVPRPPASPRLAWAGGIPLAIGTFLVAYLGASYFPEYRWVWILSPLFSMMLAKGKGPLSTSRDLMIGSVVGTGIAVVLLEVPLNMMTEMAFGLVVISASMGFMMAGQPYWIGASISTAGVIIMTGAGMNPTLAAESRLWFGLIGAIAALVIGAICIASMRHAARGSSDDTSGSMSSAEPA